MEMDMEKVKQEQSLFSPMNCLASIFITIVLLAFFYPVYGAHWFDNQHAFSMCFRCISGLALVITMRPVYCISPGFPRSVRHTHVVSACIKMEPIAHNAFTGIMAQEAGEAK